MRADSITTKYGSAHWRSELSDKIFSRQIHYQLNADDISKKDYPEFRSFLEKIKCTVMQGRKGGTDQYSVSTKPTIS